MFIDYHIDINLFDFVFPLSVGLFSRHRKRDELIDLSNQRPVVAPVVTIAATGVELRHFDIEVTVAHQATDKTGVAIKIETSTPRLELDNVRLSGRISGLGVEDRQWVLPSKLDLGQFAP